MATLKYYLRKNFLTTNDNEDCYAHATDVETISYQQLKEQTARGFMGEQKRLIEQAIDRYNEVIAQAVADAKNVSTPLFNLHLGIKGVFKSIVDSFTPPRNYVHVAFSDGEALKAVCKTIKVQKVPASEVSYIEEMYDQTQHNSIDSMWRNGDIIRLRGHNIKMADSAQGYGQQGSIYMENVTSKVSYGITIERLIDNKASEIVFQVPFDMTEGTYEMKLYTYYSGSSSPLHNPRIIPFPYRRYIQVTQVLSNKPE